MLACPWPGNLFHSLGDQLKTIVISPQGKEQEDMPHIILLQLPIPQLVYGLKTGNIPLAAACLKRAVRFLTDVRMEILPESQSAYLGDAAMIRIILAKKPDVVGFSVFNWNIDRSLYMAGKLKEAGVSRILFGGPEITPDNPRLCGHVVDHFVVGSGETALMELLRAPGIGDEPGNAREADDIFSTAPSPYLSGLLEPHIDDLVYFESQRGCPYRCGFCYYHKSKDRTVFVSDQRILETVQWTLDHHISELCLLDPSLNARPCLKPLLKQIAALNHSKNLTLSAEIRAEAIDPEMADLFAAAGFTGFEIGLQSVMPEALAIMHRPTDLERFLSGVHLLKERGILPRIDLIVGLPGDTPDGFRKSLDFVQEHHLYDDIQVFPLSVLPGTDFRRNSRNLGLVFEQEPPYTVISTPAFSSEDMSRVFEEAEERLDTALFPAPHLNICLRKNNADRERFSDQWVQTGGESGLFRLVIYPERTKSDLTELSAVLTHPYQLLVPPGIQDWNHIRAVLTITTTTNPFTPFELIVVEPATLPNTEALLASVRLMRPHYLDNDLRFLYDARGNRAVLFTLLSTKEQPLFQDEMQRQVFWWQSPSLPESVDLESLNHLDGILIDCPCPDPLIFAWQDRMFSMAPDLPAVCFAGAALQKRWISLTMADQYYLDTLPTG